MFMLLEFGKKGHFFIRLWWISFYELPDIHLVSLSLHPLHRTVGGRKQDEKYLRLSERQRDHLPIAIKCETDPGKINWKIAIKTRGLVEKNIRTKILSLIPPFFHRLSFTPSFPTPLPPPCCEWQRWMRNGVVISPWEFHSALHNFPCFSAGSLCGLLSFQNRSCVGPLEVLQFLRINLLQRWSFRGCSSFRPWPPALARSPQQAAAWITAPPQVPSMGCRGNLGCGAWSAFPPPSLTSLLQDSFSHFCFPQWVPRAEFGSPSGVALRAEGSAVPSGRLLGAGCSRPCLPWSSSGLSSESSLRTPIAARTWFWESWEKQPRFTLNCVRVQETVPLSVRTV